MGKELDPASCHPGFTLRPLQAKYVGGETILLTNSTPFGHGYSWAQVVVLQGETRESVLISGICRE